MWLALLRYETNLEGADRNASMWPVDVCVLSGTGLKFQHVLILIERPDTSECHSEVLHEGFRKMFKNASQRAVAFSKSRVDVCT